MKNFLVFAKKVDIRVISLDVDYYADVVLPIRELQNTVAVDVDRKEGDVSIACHGGNYFRGHRTSTTVY